MTPRPAATLILFRPAAPPSSASSDAPTRTADQHLFVVRARRMSFAGGATVFPGGRVEEGDFAVAAAFPSLGRDDVAARIAAIRETLEETGLAVGLGAARAEQIADIRDHLGRGESFGTLLERHGLTPDPEALQPFARWRPPSDSVFSEKHVFDTRFYIARCDHCADEASVDATENTRLFWASAKTVLTRADAGALSIIFPTRRNLERLAALGDFDAACAQARAIPPTLIEPFTAQRDGKPHLCIPEGRGYPVTGEALEKVQRR